MFVDKVDEDDVFVAEDEELSYNFNGEGFLGIVTDAFVGFFIGGRAFDFPLNFMLDALGCGGNLGR